MSTLTIKEKIGYALGDGAANIAWRGVATFLFIFYTDVFGLHPVTVGMLMLVARFSDGISDVLMGIIGDRTKSRFGKFRPWILWTAIPLALILALLFTSPDFNETGKIIYAYITYILFTLIYTANNIPYGALMGVMTGDDKERVSLGSYRMVGAFGGGLLVQGALLYLVLYFGNINPIIKLDRVGDNSFLVEVSSNNNVENVNINTKGGIATFTWENQAFYNTDKEATVGKSFSIEKDRKYTFLVQGIHDLEKEDIQVVDQKEGYSNAMYLMAVILAVLMLITFSSVKERVQPPKAQKNNLLKDLKELITNKPWLVLLVTGLLFNIYNSIKQGIVIIYFTHFLKHQIYAASYLVSLMIASVIGAVLTIYLSKKLGKRNLFIYALIFSGAVNALLAFCGPQDVEAIFAIGFISEVAAAIFPTLFFVMLGDVADYSEYINKRRATGLIYSAGSFATKFGGGIAGAIIGLVLGAYHYNGQDISSIETAVPGIIMLMSWVPAILTLFAAVMMWFYPLNKKEMNTITAELKLRRAKAELK